MSLANIAQVERALHLSVTGSFILDDQAEYERMKGQKHPDVYFRSNPWGQRAKKYARFVEKLNATQWAGIIGDAMAMHSGGDGAVNAVDDDDDEFGDDSIHIGWCVSFFLLIFLAAHDHITPRSS